MNETNFTCADCKQTKPIQTSGGTGYATLRTGEKICYDCCGARDAKEMDEQGKIVLYLTKGNDQKPMVANWPSTLKFPVSHGFKGKHNIAGVRYDVWFKYNGFYWHGVQYGDNTQICHCKKTKKKV